MTPKHTPKPWTFSPQKGKPGSCFLAQVWTPDGKSLADIEPTESEEEANANARLIASAPDLLEEIKETHAALCMGDSGYLGSERYQRNREAITQAQGFYFE